MNDEDRSKSDLLEAVRQVRQILAADRKRIQELETVLGRLLSASAKGEALTFSHPDVARANDLLATAK